MLLGLLLTTAAVIAVVGGYPGVGNGALLGVEMAWLPLHCLPCGCAGTPPLGGERTI